MESTAIRVHIGVFLYPCTDMGRRRKEPYTPKTFESMGNSDDTSANIYVSMLMSWAWQQLTKNAQVLYLYCKAQLYAQKKKPKPQVVQLDDLHQRLCFTMNKSKWQSLYHIYNSDNGQFNKDMKMLIDYGFIECIENGKSTRTKSIYMLSDKWRNKTE